MIVKNEIENMERCLSAVSDHIDFWVICDTGSSDGTVEYIKEFFGKRKKPGELHEFPFVNFEQARNEALRRAYDSVLSFDYLMLHDADMELVVEDSDFREKLGHPGYAVIQKSSGLNYWNNRLVKRDAGAWYKGVTHEYLDLSCEAEKLSGIWYRDHASGSNRVDKFDRDANLLSEALKTEPDNARYWFYLAQSYRDAGRIEQAASAYARRASMGGWAEEVWQARLQYARCLRSLGDESGFIAAALAAYNDRPWRAEPLYDLAKHYRENGKNSTSLLFSDKAMLVPFPNNDILFVESWIYKWGIKEEFSICAYYSNDADCRLRGKIACEYLSNNDDIPVNTKELANSNLIFYNKNQ